MSPHSPPDEPPSWFIIKVTAIASLGGCLFGYDMGAIAVVLPKLTTAFDLDESQQEWVVSILYLGGGLGALVGGSICDGMGRQKTIVGTDVVFIFGAAWLYFANSYEHVLMGRFVVGVAVAVSGVADVSYLHEIAPVEWRGAIVSVNEACISLGFLLAYVAGYCYNSADDEEWRIIFGWAGILALVQLVGMWGMPESPVWLAEKGRMEESRRAFQQIHGGLSSTSRISDPSVSPSTSEHHLEGLDDGGEDFMSPEMVPTFQHTEGLKRIESVSSLGSDPRGRSTLSLWFSTFSARFQSLQLTLARYRRQVYIALFLAVTQQFCGQTNVLNYAPHIFAEAAGEDDPPAWSTLAIGLVKFVVTVLVIWRIEFIGRRTLLLVGMTLVSIGLLALIVAFGGSKTDDPDSWSTNLKSFDLALPGVLLVVCGYSMSFGPLTWLLTSEIFPTDIRGRALGATTIITYLCASFVTKTFLSAQSALGPSKVFGIYCIVTTAGIVFAYLAIPDTGEKTAEQIEVALHQMWWWRYDAVALSQKEDDESSTPASSTTGSYTFQAGEPPNIEMTLSHPNLRELT